MALHTLQWHLNAGVPQAELADELVHVNLLLKACWMWHTYVCALACDGELGLGTARMQHFALAVVAEVSLINPSCVRIFYGHTTEAPCRHISM